MKFTQEMENKISIAEIHHNKILLKNWYRRIRQFQVYKQLVKIWYESYCEFREDPSFRIEEDEHLKFDKTRRLDHQTEYSLIQEVQKIETIFTDDSRIIQNKPVSFLDDTLLSNKK